MFESTHQPFVLRGMRQLPTEPRPGPEHVYDRVRQIWICAYTGKPLVLKHVDYNRSARALSSEFGETILTKTSEGVDQTESTRASEFGETVVTRTSEGQDQTEGIRASEFGETVITETREGVDQVEGIRASDFGETLVTATSEGVDQSEPTERLADSEAK